MAMDGKVPREPWMAGAAPLRPASRYPGGAAEHDTPSERA